jgi:hypothetical protein
VKGERKPEMAVVNRVWIVSDLCASKPWDTNEVWSPRAAFTTEELAHQFVKDAKDEETLLRVESFYIPVFSGLSRGD